MANSEGWEFVSQSSRNEAVEHQVVRGKWGWACFGYTCSVINVTDALLPS